MNQPKEPPKYKSKPVIRINFNSEEGNIFFIISKAAKFLRKNNILNAENIIKEMKSRISVTDSYDKGLEIIEDYVVIVPDDM